MIPPVIPELHPGHKAYVVSIQWSVGHRQRASMGVALSLHVTQNPRTEARLNFPTRTLVHWSRTTDPLPGWSDTPPSFLSSTQAIRPMWSVFSGPWGIRKRPGQGYLYPCMLFRTLGLKVA